MYSATVLRKLLFHVSLVLLRVKGDFIKYERTSKDHLKEITLPQRSIANIFIHKTQKYCQSVLRKLSFQIVPTNIYWTHATSLPLCFITQCYSRIPVVVSMDLSPGVHTLLWLPSPCMGQNLDSVPTNRIWQKWWGMWLWVGLCGYIKIIVPILLESLSPLLARRKQAGMLG